MIHRYGIAGALLVALALMFGGAPAHAQVSVYISEDGSDANDCLTPATACRGFSQAQTVVLSGGVIRVLPGRYSAAAITKSVQIIADAGEAIIQGGSVSAGGSPFVSLVVNAGPSDVVLVHGMIIDDTLGGGGIALVSGGALHIDNCTLVSAPALFAIHFRPNGNSNLVVSNSTIAGNAGGGIEVLPGTGAFANVTIDNTRLVSNSRALLAVNGANVMVRNSMITGNAIGVRVGSAAVVRMADSTVSGNATGLSSTSNAQIVSHRGNVVANNTTNGAFTSTVDQQ
jgi:Right handed beta helix region